MANVTLMPQLALAQRAGAQKKCPLRAYQKGRPSLRTRKGTERASTNPAAARGRRQPNGGFEMQDEVMFLDCPAYMDAHGAERCGLPAEIEDSYSLRSSDGPLAGAKIRCPRGHWFNGPLESLIWASPQARTRPAQTAHGLGSRGNSAAPSQAR